MSQERINPETLESRVQRIERVLDQSMLGQFQRVDRLQQEIRLLLGEIESLRFELSQTQKRQSDLYDDTDRRITALEVSPGGLNLLDEDGVLIDGGVLNDPGNSSDDVGAVLSPDRVSSDGAVTVIVNEDQPSIAMADMSAFGDGPFPPVTELRNTATNAEQQAYSEAYEQLARGQVGPAVQSFNRFLSDYPNGPYSDNAWYWLGEAMYKQRNFDDALRNFSVVVNAFPESQKVADARLKVGFSLFEQQQFEEAREILTGVQNEYPGRSASVLARKRLQQMDREGL